MSIFLCSLLRGAGYNAYVVTGTAPLWVTSMDFSDQPCPFDDNPPSADGLPDDSWGFSKYTPETRALLAARGYDARRLRALGYTDVPDDDEDDAPASADAAPRRYAPKPPLELHSAFVEQAEAERAALKRMRREAAEAKAAAELQQQQQRDLLGGDRVHAWVLVLPADQQGHRGSQRVPAEPVFLEPSSGVAYAPADAPYLGITSVFNERQFWACLSPHLPPGELGVDLADSRLWEPLLPAASAADAEAASPASALADPSTPSPLSLVSAPPSWVQRPSISREEHRARFPTGRRVTFYRGVVLERFQEFEPGLQGLVQQRTSYHADDVTLSAPVRVSCVYRHRSDGLCRRVSYPAEDRAHEAYGAGREGGLREVAQITTKHRLLLFDPRARVDRLAARLETVAAKVVEVFEGRGDRLLCRAVTADAGPAPGPNAGGAGAGGGAGADAGSVSVGRAVTLSLGRGPELAVHRISETFGRDASRPAHDDVCKRTFLLAEQRIRTQYHRCGRALRPAVKVLDKRAPAPAAAWAHPAPRPAPAPAPGPSSASGSVPCACGQADEGAAAWCAGARREAALAVWGLQSACVREVREREKALGEVLQRAELAKHAAGPEPGAHRQAEERAAAGRGRGSGTGEKEGGEECEDVLSVFVAGLGAGAVRPDGSLGRAEAEVVRGRCLGAARERLVERAGVMQARLEAEKAKLQQTQGQFKRTAGSGVERDEELQQRYQQSLFAIEVLKTRIRLHEEAAVAKYVALEQRLRQHPMLKALWEE